MDEQPSSDVKAQRNNTSDCKPAEGEKPTKQQIKRLPPDVLCSCPQRCDTRVPAEARTKLYSHFSKLGDHATQNAYLQSYIEMRSVYRRLWAEEEKVRGRLPRRVSCKYRIPISEMPPIENVDFPKPKLITNSKGKETFVMTARGKGKTIEVCQKAFMNVYGITEKRVRLQREKLIDRLRNRSPPPLSPIHHYMDEDLSSQMEEEEDGTLAVAIVDSFFQNQLWKPEYIGMGKEKIEHIKA